MGAWSPNSSEEPGPDTSLGLRPLVSTLQALDSSEASRAWNCPQPRPPGRPSENASSGQRRAKRSECLRRVLGEAPRRLASPQRKPKSRGQTGSPRSHGRRGRARSAVPADPGSMLPGSVLPADPGSDAPKPAAPPQHAPGEG